MTSEQNTEQIATIRETLQEHILSIQVYQCSVCDYKTVNKSNMNSHLVRKCVDGRVRKRKGFVTTLGPFEDDGIREPERPSEAVMEENNAIKLRRIMERRESIENVDERITYFIYTQEGREKLAIIYRTASLLDQFILFIKYAVGNGAPTPLKSIAKYGRQGKSVIIQRDLSATIEQLRRHTTVTLLQEMYGMFENICALQPQIRRELHPTIRDGWRSLDKALKKPIDRPSRPHIRYTLKQILEARRRDDDVMDRLVHSCREVIDYIDSSEN